MDQETRGYKNIAIGVKSWYTCEWEGCTNDKKNSRSKYCPIHLQEAHRKGGSDNKRILRLIIRIKRKEAQQ